MPLKDAIKFCPSSQKDWRQWLLENHKAKDSVWLVYFKKKTQIPSLTWSEAVDEALCFGWIDSRKKTIDEKSYMQYFSKRKPKSIWSKINKDKVTKLIDACLMTSTGLESINIAKQNGSWTLFDGVDALIIPSDLESEFKTNKEAHDFFLGFSNSNRKSILYWIASAKRPQTREKRIKETVELASQRLIPKQFR